jgi:hypothetical protein
MELTNGTHSTKTSEEESSGARVFGDKMSIGNYIVIGHGHTYKAIRTMLLKLEFSENERQRELKPVTALHFAR